jgi:hypothetical protein
MYNLLNIERNAYDYDDYFLTADTPDAEFYNADDYYDYWDVYAIITIGPWAYRARLIWQFDADDVKDLEAEDYPWDEIKPICHELMDDDDGTDYDVTDLRDPVAAQKIIDIVYNPNRLINLINNITTAAKDKPY